MDRAHYKVGWNDTAHGILTWSPHDQWASALEWALHCKAIALSLPSTDYLKGVIGCVDEYQEIGRIAKL